MRIVSIRRSGSAIPTILSASIVRLRVSARLVVLMQPNRSLIWLPMVKTGFSEVIGSWKIIAIRAPRT